MLPVKLVHAALPPTNTARNKTSRSISGVYTFVLLYTLIHVIAVWKKSFFTKTMAAATMTAYTDDLAGKVPHTT
jgi:hypothetical protein